MNCLVEDVIIEIFIASDAVSRIFFGITSKRLLRLLRLRGTWTLRDIDSALGSLPGRVLRYIFQELQWSFVNLTRVFESSCFNANLELATEFNFFFSEEEDPKFCLAWESFQSIVRLEDLDMQSKFKPFELLYSMSYLAGALGDFDFCSKTISAFYDHHGVIWGRSEVPFMLRGASRFCRFDLFDRLLSIREFRGFYIDYGSIVHRAVHEGSIPTLRRYFKKLEESGIEGLATSSELTAWISSARNENILQEFIGLLLNSTLDKALLAKSLCSALWQMTLLIKPFLTWLRGLNLEVFDIIRENAKKNENDIPHICLACGALSFLTWVIEEEIVPVSKVAEELNTNSYIILQQATPESREELATCFLSRGIPFPQELMT
jgi:hypothetical protein